MMMKLKIIQNTIVGLLLSTLFLVNNLYAQAPADSINNTTARKNPVGTHIISFVIEDVIMFEDELQDSTLNPQTNPTSHTTDEDSILIDEGIVTEVIIKDLLAEATLFPVPAKDILNIKFSQPIEDLQLRIVAMDGRLVGSRILPSQTNIQLNVNQLTNGNYLLVFRSGAAQATKRIIIQR